MYPVKEGKSKAFSHYKASVKTDKDHQDIQRALDNYLAKIKLANTETKYIQHGKTWFNNWQDYIDIPVKKSGVDEWAENEGLC